ncbi:hypothetical protein BC629DRAFT_1191767 [Irpex lacteus]|nr:hypothetical protein BC629DRAFT_1191767 [Irpex lacteus]
MWYERNHSLITLNEDHTVKHSCLKITFRKIHTSALNRSLAGKQLGERSIFWVEDRAQCISQRHIGSCGI